MRISVYVMVDLHLSIYDFLLLFYFLSVLKMASYYLAEDVIVALMGRTKKNGLAILR